MLNCTRIINDTDVKYGIICAGKNFDVGQDRSVTVMYGEKSYQAKMHSKTKGRIDGLRALYDDFKNIFRVGGVIDLSYDDLTDTVKISCAQEQKYDGVDNKTNDRMSLHKIDSKDKDFKTIMSMIVNIALIVEKSRLMGEQITFDVVEQYIDLKSFKAIIDKNWGGCEMFISDYYRPKLKSCDYNADMFLRYNMINVIYDYVSNGWNDGMKFQFFEMINFDKLTEMTKKLGLSEDICLSEKQQYIKFFKKAILHSENKDGGTVLIPGKSSDMSDFRMSKGRGIKESDRKVIGFNPYVWQIGEYGATRKKNPNSCAFWYQGKIQYQLTKACYVINGFLYFHTGRGYKSNGLLEICKMDLSTGKISIIKRLNVESNIECVLFIDQHKILKPFFSIYDNRIYYPDDGCIYSMDLNGGDVRPVKGFTKNRRIKYCGVWAFDGGMLLFSGETSVYRYIFNQDTAPELIFDKGEIIDFSDKELITESGKVVDVLTKERKSLTKVYPSLAGKELFWVDSVNEIAYYLEKNDNWIYVSNIVGTDKSGKIVDIWNIPLIPKKRYDFMKSSYETLIFNGIRMMGKFNGIDLDMRQRNNNHACGSYIAEYDRDGFENVLSYRNSDDCRSDYFAAYHYVIGDMNLVVRVIAKGRPYQEYQSVISHDGKEFPFAPGYF